MGEDFSSLETTSVLHINTISWHGSLQTVWLGITINLLNHALEAGALAVQAAGIVKDLPMSQSVPDYMNYQGHVEGSGE